MGLKNLAKQVREEEKSLKAPVQEKFVEALDQFIVRSRTRKAEERPVRKAFNPSSYYKCARMQWYKLQGVPEKKQRNARSERILEVGTALHEWVQTKVLMEIDAESDSLIHLVPKEEIPAYGKVGIEFIEEHNAAPTEVKFIDTRYTKEIPISAMVDGVIHFQGKDYLFEFKTINPKDYSTLIEVPSDYVKQGALYSLCTGISSVIFLFICKGTQNWKAFVIEYTDAQREWVVQRIQQIESHVLSGTLPDKEVSDQCKWCGYKMLCDKDRKA